MKYETFNPKRHDILKVASLIYDVDFRTFDLFFRNKNKAVKAISKSIADEDLDTFKVILDDENNIVFNSKNQILTLTSPRAFQGRHRPPWPLAAW